MSYYENRIKALEKRVADMARDQRMKGIPVEAKLVELIARLQGENKRLRKAGDAMAEAFDLKYPVAGGLVTNWNAAKKGKQS